MSSSGQLIPGFTRLSFNTYLFQPKKSIHHSDTSKSSAPDLILLHTWLNALPKHIAKYTLAYQNLYPTSTILLTTSSWHDWAYRSQATQDASLRPVLEYILSLSDTAKMLVHLFSNGGASTVIQVAYKYKLQTGRPLPVSKMILDSSPGKGGYRRSITAFAASLPTWKKNPIHRLVGVLSIHIGLCVSFIISAIILRRENPIMVLRRSLNDKTLFSLDAARLYFYGDKDVMVSSEEVIEHAAEAEVKGWEVSQERYVDSGHVTHAAVDSERYWGAVQRLWGDADM